MRKISTIFGVAAMALTTVAPTAGEVEGLVLRSSSATSPTPVRPSGPGWYLDVINADDSDLDTAYFGSRLDGTGWAVAVIDDGIDSGHPYLSDATGKSRVIAEACRTNRNCSGGAKGADGPGSAAHSDNRWHGTHVAGIAIGDGRGQRPAVVRGVARAADLVAVKVSESNGSTLGSNVDAALRWILDQRLSGMRIASVNLSLSSLVVFPGNCDKSSPTTKKIIDDLLASGVVVVTATGNAASRTGTTWPACLSNILPVGSITFSMQVSNESNIGPVVANQGLLAPGQSICSSVNRTRATTGYGCTSGTSMAAPQVAGAVALLRQKFPSLSAGQIVTALRSTATTISDTRPGGTTSGLRVLDVAAAIAAAAGL
ncbi:MAG: hypothetical protein FGM45_05295 [Actinobacteria bacterium]|nr:hypothetical protein [Actinomycetota bacterium]